MRQTKKVTLSAMLVALGTVMMILGALFEIVDLSVCALASLLVVFAYIELGAPYVYLVWLCTSLATALMFPGSIVWIEYFFVFGIYPILKAFIEKRPRVFWLPLKLGFINAMTWAIIGLSQLVFGAPLFASELFIMKVFAYILVNVAFVVYDAFITVMIRLYFDRFRKRFKKFLK